MLRENKGLLSIKVFVIATLVGVLFSAHAKAVDESSVSSGLYSVASRAVHLICGHFPGALSLCHEQKTSPPPEEWVQTYPLECGPSPIRVHLVNTKSMAFQTVEISDLDRGDSLVHFFKSTSASDKGQLFGAEIVTSGGKITAAGASPLPPDASGSGPTMRKTVSWLKLICSDRNSLDSFNRSLQASASGLGSSVQQKPPVTAPEPAPDIYR